MFGLLPALRATKLDLHSAAKAANTGGQPSHSRLQGALVGVQIAVCFVLMIAASLMLRGLYETHTAEPGFHYENVAVASVSLDGYDAERAEVFEGELMSSLRALSGIETVARALMPPLSEGMVHGLAGMPGQESLSPIDRNDVSADYFSLLEIPMVRGRTFTATDENAESAENAATATSTAAIVTETTARRLWPERDPIGQRLVVETEPNRRREVEIVGVARDAQVRTIGEIPSSYVYLPAQRNQRLQFLAKSRGGYATAAAALRREVAALDPGVAVSIAPLEANLDMFRSLARVVSTLALALGVIALVLAGVGVYGVVTYVVGRQTREIALRVALGAQPRDVIMLVLKRTMRPVFVGSAVGLLLGMALSRVLSSVLFGVSPADPAALLFAMLVVVGCAVAAGVIPARRASHANPNAVLHYE
jgi:predicted permease